MLQFHHGRMFHLEQLLQVSFKNDKSCFNKINQSDIELSRSTTSTIHHRFTAHSRHSRGMSIWARQILCLFLNLMIYFDESCQQSHHTIRHCWIRMERSMRSIGRGRLIFICTFFCCSEETKSQ